MDVLIAILTLTLVAITVLVVSAPLRRRGSRGDQVPSQKRSRLGAESSSSPAASAREEREQLEAARAAKYREIRDAELDYRTGKLSQADYDVVDAELRAEAVEILNRLESEEL